jgi:hypothetical protein
MYQRPGPNTFLLLGFKNRPQQLKKFDVLMAVNVMNTVTEL